MAKTRELRRRIKSVQSTRQITKTVEMHLVGRKGISFFKFSHRTIASQRIDIGDKPTAAHAAELVAPLMARFATGELDAVEIVFAKFNSAMSTPPTTLRILPVDPPAD